jgi:hypothetical protein
VKNLKTTIKSSTTAREQLALHDLMQNEIATAKKVKTNLEILQDQALKSLLQSALITKVQMLQDWQQWITNTRRAQTELQIKTGQPPQSEQQLQ